MTTKKPKDGPTTRYPDICADGWPANPGDPVEWQNPPQGGTTIKQYGNNRWPFTLASPFPWPNAPSAVLILPNLPPNKYYYWVDSCPNEGAPKSVDVS
jgi:hypothetical protein